MTAFTCPACKNKIEVDSPLTDEPYTCSICFCVCFFDNYAEALIDGSEYDSWENWRGVMKPRNIPYPMEDIKKWLSDLGWRGSVPTSKAESMALLRRLQEKKDFSGNQFEYLLSLGYYGDQPKNMADAAELIEKTKKNRNWWKSKSQKKADRKQWLSDRREENRDNIRSDIEDTAEFFRDMGRDADIGEALVGWVIDFTPNARCKYRSEYAGLIYTADTTVEDLVKHMPPFDDCPTDCEECNLEVKFFKDTGPNLNVFLWDGMKKRKSVPKYIISPKLH